MVRKRNGAGTGADGWELAAPFSALVPGSSGATIDGVLDGVRLEMEQVGRLADEPGKPDGGDALVVAKDNGVAADAVTTALYRTVYDAVPEVDAVLADGGPMLDLGCGIGGALFTTARLYPDLSLVGVDLVPEVVAEAERRRDALGLADRVELTCADARDLTDRGTYRAAYWARAFFPDESRAATLAVLRRALTADGLLLLQEQPLPPDPLAAAVERLQQRQRGITAGRTVDELVAEAREAGFRLVRPVPTALGNLVLLSPAPTP
ncbi:SAM-dependent methyltransferase [Cryptosporangium phraense]|uniref:Class I SAM-dependent methyltransferase n=1 Tax=Cryptosporangium phraense TaxID=2593070 RepID=A0A545AEK2_9ACTN|nr:class I SAM-dependent methyltransferase [Cryptosporangium phraense]TQS39766.1 class I SAM-dependent methyltransferase [Cryptosporangium phraense]